MKQFFSAVIAVITLFMASQALAQPPCPDPNFAVEPQCQPALPWTWHRNVVSMPTGCLVLVTWCDQWVCSGFAGLSRSRVSISSMVFLNINSCTPGCNPQNASAMVACLLQAMVEQGILPHRGSPRPCDDPTNDDHLYEVMTTPCYTVYNWGGIVDGNYVQSLEYSFCDAEIACSRKYKFCTDANGNIVKDKQSAQPINSQGNPFPPGSIVCGGSTSLAPTAPTSYVGVGNLTGQSFNVEMIETSSDPEYYCTNDCQ